MMQTPIAAPMAIPAFAAVERLLFATLELRGWAGVVADVVDVAVPV